MTLYAVRSSDLKAGDPVEKIIELSSGGECVVINILELEAKFDPNTLVTRERTMKGINAYRHAFPEVLKLMEKAYFNKNYVTSHMKVDDIVENGFEVLVKERNPIKIMVEPK